MAAFSTTPQGAGPATGDIGPAVIHVRRPRLGASESPIAAELVLAGVDDTLPPTVLRLLNLATLPSSPSTLNKVFSILHWCFIGLGSLIALWLIFGGRGGPKPTGDEAPAAPARAQVDVSPAFASPKLDTAGDSDAPKWTPPASVSSSAPAAEFVPPSGGFTHQNNVPPAATTPVVTEPAAPSHESWPQSGSAAPPAAESPMPEMPNPEMSGPAAAQQPEMPALPQPEMPAAPAWQGASSAPVGAPVGPVARTAAREVPAAAPAPGGEAHPLDLTVPVPQ